MVVSISQAEQYSLQIPAHRFSQGGREAYYFALDMATLDGLLPQRVDESVVREANRRLTPSHAKNIEDYLMGCSDWVMGGMLLGIAPDAVEFEPYPEELVKQPDGSAFGRLSIRTRRINTMRIFDGQHRRRAVQDALYQLGNDPQRADQLAALQHSSISVVLYAEDDLRALRQMFADASKTKRIEAHVVTRFDRRDPFNLAAKHLSEQSALFGGRVEMERTTAVGMNRSLIAINQLSENLKTLEVGYHRRVSRERNDELMLAQERLYQRCLTWTDEFLPAARDEFSGLLSGQITGDHIPSWRARSFAYSNTFIRIMAGCYHAWVTENPDWQPLADFVRGASLEIGDSDSLLSRAGTVAPDGKSLVARRQEVAGAIRHIIAEAKADGG